MPKVTLSAGPIDYQVSGGSGPVVVLLGGLAMAFKLIEPAQSRWRAVNAPHLVAFVRAGVRFEAGKLVERPEKVVA